MAEYKLRITSARPFFAELPYYVWGQVNYDSEGDCTNPLDRNWTWMELTHRDNDDHIEVSSVDAKWTITGPDPSASRIAYFLRDRCDGESIAGGPDLNLRDWSHPEAAERASRVAAEFQNDILAPFAEGHCFWGSWKWIGWFATDCTWVGRWIMDSVVRNDSRAANLCVEWLREGTFAEPQSVALRHALKCLTGLSHATDEEWVHWYDSGSGKEQFPEPDFNGWYEDLKATHGE